MSGVSCSRGGRAEFRSQSYALAEGLRNRGGLPDPARHCCVQTPGPERMVRSETGRTGNAPPLEWPLRLDVWPPGHVRRQRRGVETGDTAPATGPARKPGGAKFLHGVGGATPSIRRAPRRRRWPHAERYESSRIIGWLRSYLHPSLSLNAISTSLPRT